MRGPGNTETCFSWPWTRPKFSMQLVFQVWWCVVFNFVGTSRPDIEASLLASTFPKVVLYPLFCFRLFLALFIEDANAALLSTKDLNRVTDANLYARRRPMEGTREEKMDSQDS